MMTLLDRSVGEILQKRETLGLTENTMLIFTSDNGPSAGGEADLGFFGSSGPCRDRKSELLTGLELPEAR